MMEMIEEEREVNGEMPMTLMLQMVKEILKIE